MAETFRMELFKKSSLMWNRFLDSWPFNRYLWLAYSVLFLKWWA